MMASIQNKVWVVSLAVLSIGFSDNALWQKQNSGIDDGEVIQVQISLDNPQTIYAASSRTIYSSQDHGQHYKALWSIPQADAPISDLKIYSQQIFLATFGGLYLSLDEGKTWNKVFNTASYESGQILSILCTPENVFLGTKGGVFKKNIKERSWQRVNGLLPTEPIYHVSESGGLIYLATDKDVYQLDPKLKTTQKIFSLAAQTQELPIATSDVDTEGAEEAASLIKSIQLFQKPFSAIFIATTKGILWRSSGHEEWQTMPSSHLDLEGLKDFLAFPSEQECLESSDLVECFNFFAATQRGVVSLARGQWVSLYRGMETNHVNRLAYDAQNTVYAATSAGVFQLSLKETLPSIISSESQGFIFPPDYLEKIKSEPSIKEVHQWSIHYAEVSNDKIKQWRRQAKSKAMLPSLNIGLDREATEVFHWDTGSNPDTLQKGRDTMDWDVSLTWDFGELIWNNDQTSIDSRSKLMVELRESVIDQVTRIYFERRRVQSELTNVPQTDQKLRLDLEMRVEELTALLDGWTGGKFSETIQVDQM